MAIHRLRVLYKGEKKGQGTAWNTGPRDVVTAFHVVGSAATQTWLSDEADGYGYQIEPDEGSPVGLVPVLADSHADLAILRAAEDLDGSPLPLAETVPKTTSLWSSEGFPRKIGRRFTLHGKISSIKPGRSDRAWQLFVDQGTELIWKGVSGAPVQVDGGVAGVIIRQTGQASTLWAAPLDALRELLGLARRDEELAGDCHHLLMELYESVDELRQLAEALGWTTGGWETEISQKEAAEWLSRRGLRDGAKAFKALLREVEVDDRQAGDSRVRQIEERLLHLMNPDEELFARPSRNKTEREMIRLLRFGKCSGVALFEPLGFGGLGVLNRVVEALKDPELKELPVRLAPDRRRHLDETRIYGPLLRGLRWELERQINKPLRGRWAAAFPDPQIPVTEPVFDNTLEELVTGPVSDESRTLILVLERLEKTSLQHWEELLKRLVLARELPLRFLLLGGQQLHNLILDGSLDTENTSPWDLKRKTLEHLSHEEVEEQVKKQNGGDGWSSVLLELTGGHPALVEELLERGRRELRAGDQEGLKDWLLSSWWLQRLKRLVDQDRDLHQSLRKFAASGPSQGMIEHQERLLWLGIVKREGPSEWRWVTPIFEEWVKGWPS